MMLLKIINPLLFISFLIQAVTGIALAFNLVGRIEWLAGPVVEIHEYNGLFMIIAIFAHLALNWGWVKTQFFKR
ncbi:MAG: DUF4405 domain-containing protein [Candidatus Omnitrophota bacterium]|jgi:hypothetical protein